MGLFRHGRDNDAPAVGLEQTVNRAIELKLYGQPLPRSVDLALTAVYSRVLHRDGDASWEHQKMCGHAAWLGWTLRQAEFEPFGGEPDMIRLDVFLSQTAKEKTFGPDWFATVMGAAASLSDLAKSEARRKEFPELVEPTALGWDGHSQAVATLVSCIDADNQPLLEDTEADVRESIRYGYWYRACFEHIPVMVRDVVFLSE